MIHEPMISGLIPFTLIAVIILKKKLIRRVAISSNHQVSSFVISCVEFFLKIFQEIESQHLLTICRFSAQGDSVSHDLRTVMESFHDERTTNVKKASVFEIRFPSSIASVISRNSDAHLNAATFSGFKVIGRP